MDYRLQPQLSPMTHIRVGTNAFVFILKLVVKVLENFLDGNLILRFKYGGAEGQGGPKNLCWGNFAQIERSELIGEPTRLLFELKD